jgi:hypothetical protein
MQLCLEVQQNVGQGRMGRHAQASDKKVLIYHGLIIVQLRHSFSHWCPSFAL